jgi:hypothetical protein
MTALYILAGEYRQAADRLADMDLDDQTIADTLESISGDLEVKATNVAMFARNLESLAQSIKEAEAQMAARRKAIETRASRIRDYLLQNMSLTGITKIDSPMFTIAIRNNPPSVDVFDRDQIPVEYMRQPEPPPPEPDKTRIKDAIKSGLTVPGARIKIGQRLDIK